MKKTLKSFFANSLFILVGFISTIFVFWLGYHTKDCNNTEVKDNITTANFSTLRVPNIKDVESPYCEEGERKFMVDNDGIYLYRCEYTFFTGVAGGYLNWNIKKEFDCMSNSVEYANNLAKEIVKKEDEHEYERRIKEITDKMWGDLK